MSSKEIEIIQDTGRPRVGDHVSVHTYVSPADGVTRLPIVDASQWFGPAAPGGGMQIAQLINMKPCSHEEALRVAREYATLHGIPRIYVKKS